MPRHAVLTVQHLRLPQAVRDALGVRAEALAATVREFNERHASLMTPADSQSVGRSASGGSGRRGSATRTPRTQSRPVFTPPAAPVNVTQRVELSEKLPSAEFANRYEPPCRSFIHAVL